MRTVNRYRKADALPFPTSAADRKSDRGAQAETSFVLRRCAGVPKRRPAENLFSDEPKIVLGDDTRWVWYRRGEDNPSATRTIAKYPPSLMAFAVIVVEFKSKLVIIEETVNAETYRRNIETSAFMDELDQLHGLFQWIIQQDGAPVHTTRSTVTWLGHVCVVLAGWPPNSPDLSPIELGWAILKKAVTFLMPTTIEQLKEIVTHAWEQIS